MTNGKKSIQVTGDVRNSAFIIGNNNTVNIGSGPLLPEETARLLAEYRARLLEQTAYVNLRGIPLPRGRDGRPARLNVPLDKVYVRLQATEEKQHRQRSEAEERALQDQVRDNSEYTGPKDILIALRTLGEFFYRRGEVIEIDERLDPVDPQEALEKHKRLVALGAPGAGKSTLLRYLARRAAEKPDGMLPILVPLRDFATALSQESTLSVREFGVRLAAAGDEKLHRALETEIEAGHILWLVDALDEARNWAADAAQQAGLLPGQLIVTSRPVGYVGVGLQALPHFEVLPLQAKEVEQFLQSWFGLLADQRETDASWIKMRAGWLKEQLEARPRLKPLMRSPLLLTFLAVLAGEDPQQELPTQRAELYRVYVNDLLDSWETERRPKGGVDGEPIFKLGDIHGVQARQTALDCFHYLGWVIHLNYYSGKPQNAPTRETLIPKLAAYLRESLGKQAELTARAALEFWREAGLIETWHINGQDYLAFRHLTFQEYAAAWGLAEAWQRDPAHTWGFLKPRLHHYAWNEPILLLVGLLPQKHLDDLVGRLLCSQNAYEEYFHRDLLLAGSLLAEGATLTEAQYILRELDGLWGQIWFPKVLFALSARIGARFIPSLIQALLGGKGQWARKEAAKVLGQVSDSQVVSVLIQALKDEEPDVRQNAAESLGQINDPQAFPALLQALEDDNDLVRQKADYAVKRIGYVRATPVVIQALQDDDLNIRHLAIKFLGQIGDWQAFYALVQVLWDKNELIRREAVYVLEEIISKQLTSPSTLTIRYENILANQQAINRTKQVINPALKGEGLSVPQNAAQTLKKIGGNQAVPSLILALRHDNALDVRLQAIKTLGQVGDSRAVPALTQTLQDIASGVRYYAAEALGQIRDRQAIPALIQTLHDESELVRSEAAKALMKIDKQFTPASIESLMDDMKNMHQDTAKIFGKIGDHQVVAVIIRSLRDDDANTRHYAVKALRQIGDRQAIPALIQALQDDSIWVRKEAAKALGLMGDRQAILGLFHALRDDSESVRQEVAKTLGLIGGRQALPGLLHTLQDNSELVRQEAAKALGQIGDQQAVPALVQALQDNSELVRQEAAKALGQIGDRQAVPALVKALLDDIGSVRQEAVVSALGQIGDQQAVPVLIQALQSSSKSIRLKVVKALGQIGDRQAIPDLIRTLRDDSELVRQDVVKILGRIGDPQAIPGLIYALQDHSESVRQEAIEALGQISSPESVSALIQILQSDKSMYQKVDRERVIREIDQIFYRLTIFETDSLLYSDPLLM